MTRTARLLTVAALACTTVGLAPAAQASAPAPEEIVTSRDAWGDVRLLPGDRLTGRQKKSIDIRKVTLSRVGARARITITMREVMRTPKFDQVFMVSMREHPDTEGGPWIADSGFTTKGEMSYSSYADEPWDTYETCGVKVTVRPRKRQVEATIPARCTPEAPVKVSVFAVAGHFRTDAPQYSRDRHRVVGWHDFRP
jgi:hypothetical protein